VKRLELKDKNYELKAMDSNPWENRGLKFSEKNGIFICLELHFFIVIIIFSGIMHYSKFTP